MKLFIVAALFVAAAMAAPTTIDGDAQIIVQNNDNIGVGPYGYEFQTSNGISQREQGQLKNVGTENEALEVQGQFSYTGTDGVVYSVTYTANELGFQAQGAHIPQAQ
ncbi:PREDICTED: flexible cuticle protein 12-like [Papilio polytes]|uniref:Cuticular protein PpolCPR4A n=1 Tax=Papilio polytes TaxID=76194 RepID=I4DLT3_PAPPL|nr:flexible cuticle protein 12-like precursor [Papilio polytes]BAM18873.1 cuticular protein PpolCPR4A [Papilio polytes]